MNTEPTEEKYVWVSAKALSRGIRSGKTTRELNRFGFAEVDGVFTSLNEIHETKEQAIAAAERMRSDEIKVLQVRIEQLSKLKFQ